MAASPETLRLDFRKSSPWSERPAQLALTAVSSFVLVLAGASQLLPGLPLVDLVRMAAPAAALLAVGWVLLRLWRRPPLEVGPLALRLPRLFRSHWPVSVPYDRVYDVATTDGGRFVLIGIHGRWPLRYPVSDFVEPDSGKLLVEATLARVGALAGGAERLQAFRQRRLLAEATQYTPWATLLFAAATLVGFAVQVQSGLDALRLTPGADPLQLVALGANQPDLVARGEFYRLVTANFLHTDLGHLYVNGLILLALGARVEGALGLARTAVILLVSAVGGAATSSAAGHAFISVGASTAVFGIAAAFAYLNIVRRTELHAGLRVPAWVGIGVVVLQIFSEFRVPNVDHFAHVGGFALGWISAAVVLGDAPLATLRDESPAAVRAGLGLVGALVVGAGIWAGVRVAAPDPRTTLWIEEQVLEQGIGAPPALHALAHDWIADRGRSSDELALARQAMQRLTDAPAPAASLARYWDTLALAYLREDRWDEAIIAQWQAQMRAGALGPGFGELATIKLALFERRRLADRGALRAGPGSDVVAAVRIEQRQSASNPAETWITLDLPDSFRREIVVHALLFLGDQLTGHLEIWLGADHDRTQLIRAAGADQFGLTAADVRIALIDTREKRALGRGPVLRLLQFTAQAAEPQLSSREAER